MSTTLRAMYNGTCAAECGNRIHPGDLIRYVAHQPMHVECAPQPEPDARPTEVICPDCRRTKPCRCDD